MDIQRPDCFFSDCLPLFDHLCTPKGYDISKNVLMLSSQTCLVQSCSNSSPGYQMTSPKLVATGDVNTDAQESSMVRRHLTFCFWGHRSPYIHLYAVLYHREIQNQLWKEGEAQHPSTAWQSSQRSISSRMFSGTFLSCRCRGLYFWSWSLLSTLLIMQSCSMTWNMSVNSVS